MMKNHQFHLVEKSPWPLIISIIIMNYTTLFVMYLNLSKSIPMIFQLMMILWVMMIWWRDIHRESTFQGMHTLNVFSSMKYGMILFIISEIMFFISFFWSFFHHSLSPNYEMGMNWPPMNILSFNPIHIPLMNTIILLSSGISVTWTHASLCSNNFFQTKNSLMLTIIMGMYFSILQLYEYTSSQFSISDSIYGSTFFLTTGFHGIHVLIGTMFLLHSMFRLNKMHFSKSHHLGIELAIWYWHFVDMVWLFLYMTIYWWGK